MPRNFETCWNCGTANFKRKRCWNCEAVLDRAQTALDLRGGENMLKKKIAVDIPEGRHAGTIVRIEYRDDPFDYTDLHVRLEDVESEQPIILKVGAPTNVSVDVKGKPRSKLAILLAKCGVDLSGEDIEPEEALNHQISFMTVNEKTEKGTFARIQPSSIEMVE